ncbi:MAG: hypothetical protein ACI9Y7_000720 [Dokdonia sp.]|jgi:hypothetical protein
MLRLTLLLLFISNFLFSQTFEDDNTLIILFDESNGSIASKTISKSPSVFNYYHIPLDDNNQKDPFDDQNNRVSFRYSIYKDFDHAQRKDSVFILKVNKSFLRKNKTIIITKDDLNTMDRLKLFLKLDGAKNIFLIDKSEIKDGKLIMRQVFFSYMYAI